MKIVAASKNRSIEEINRLIDEGIEHIGENRVQEAHKKKKLVKPVCWHLIGPLQKNKVKKALEVFDVIETVDSFELASLINKNAKKKIKILIQVNSTDENQKNGCRIDKVEELAAKIKCLDNLICKGLMTIGKKDDVTLTRKAFEKTKKLFDSLKKCTDKEFDTLSMGMSDDYETAIKAGATQVRLGKVLFEKKTSPTLGEGEAPKVMIL